MLSGYSFTDDVRHVLAMARIESHRLRLEYVGTEHLLLAFTNAEVPAAVRLLEALSVDPAGVRANIERVVQSGTSPHGSAHDLPYTSRAKKCLENALTVAREAGHTYVGVEHLLAGIIRERKGIAAQMLIDHGASEQALLAVVANVPQSAASPASFESRALVTEGTDPSLYIMRTVHGPTSMLARLWRFLRRKLGQHE